MPQKTLNENRMGTMPVGRLLFSVSAPTMLSMLVQALYNVLDSVFVSYVSEEALTAVTMAFPLQNLMIAISVGLGVGMNSYLSRSLGAKNQKNVNSAAMHGILITWMISIAFCVFGLFGSGAYMRSQTDNPQIIQYGTEYLMWVCGIPFGVFNQVIMERLLQSTGKTVYSMITQITGSVTDAFLDYALVFGFWFFPRMGVAGAAVSSVIGQCTAALVGLYFNLRKNPEIQFSFKGFRLRLDVLKQIFTVGLPSMLLSSLSSVMTYGMNLVLVKFNETAVAFFGAYLKLQSFVFLPVFGLNHGVVPIVAYNYGAKKKERIIKTIKLAMAAAFCLMLIGVLVLELMPARLLSVFNASEGLLEIGVPALRIIAAHLLTASFSIIIIAVFQAFGMGLPGLIVSFTRQIVLLLPAAYLLSLTGVIDNVWWCFLIAETGSLTMSLLLFRREYGRRIRGLAGE